MNIIPASELIINSNNNSVYHLGLQKKHLRKTIITVGDPNRSKLISTFFDSIEYHVCSREFESYVGKIGKTELMVISTGMGNDNIDIVLNELNALANICFETRTLNPTHQSLKIIRMGTTGSIHLSCKIGDFIYTKAAFGFDSLQVFYQKDNYSYYKNLFLEQNLPFPYQVFANAYLEKYFDSDKNFKAANTLTMPGFYAPQGRVLFEYHPQNVFQKIQQIFKEIGPDIYNVEMETSGIYLLSSIFKHQAISLSLVLAERNNGKFAANSENLMLDFINTCLNKICEMDIQE